MTQQTQADNNHCPKGYKQTEVGVIPEDWDVLPFGELYEQSATRKKFKLEQGVTFVGMQDVSDQAQLTEQHQIDYRSVKSGYTYFERDDVLLAKITPCFENGKGCHTKELITSVGFGSTEFHVLRSKNSSDSKFIYYWTIKTDFRENLESEMVGSAGHRRVPLSAINEYLIPCPRKKDEQTANALSDVDALLEGLEKLVAKKQAIKTATMQQLLTGKTRLPQFAHHPNGTPKDTQPTELGQIPEDWEVTTYGEAFKFLKTATNSRADLTESGDYLYVHYGDIHTKWHSFLNVNKTVMPKIKMNKVAFPSFVEDGDLIMADASEDYSGIGKSIEIFGLNGRKAIAGLHTFLIRDVANVYVHGFRGYLHSILAVKTQFDRLATGLKVYGVSKTNLKTVLISVPPKEEQTAIAQILTDMDSEIQALQTRLTKTRQIKQGMMQQLLTGKVRLM